MSHCTSFAPSRTLAPSGRSPSDPLARSTQVVLGVASGGAGAKVADFPTTDVCPARLTVTQIRGTTSGAQPAGFEAGLGSLPVCAFVVPVGALPFAPPPAAT